MNPSLSSRIRPYLDIKYTACAHARDVVGIIAPLTI